MAGAIPFFVVLLSECLTFFLEHVSLFLDTCLIFFLTQRLD